MLGSWLAALLLLAVPAGGASDQPFFLAGQHTSMSSALHLPHGGDVSVSVHYQGASFAAGLHLHGPKGCTSLDTTAGGAGPDTTIAWISCKGLPAGDPVFTLSVDAGAMKGYLHASAGSW